jgi:hypothetical protein
MDGEVTDFDRFVVQHNTTRTTADLIPWRILFPPDLQVNSTVPSVYGNSNPVQAAAPRLPYLSISFSIAPPSVETN